MNQAGQELVGLESDEAVRRRGRDDRRASLAGEDPRAVGRRPCDRPPGAGRPAPRQDEIEVVGEAADGRQAVEIAHQTHPDVVLMDVTMPVLNGIEATRRILGSLPEVRVIGLSMHAEADMALAMQKAGAVAYLRKDIPSEDLIAAILAQSPATTGSCPAPL